MTKILFTLGWAGKKDCISYIPTFELVDGIHNHGQEVHMLVSDQMELPTPALRAGAAQWLKKVRHDYVTPLALTRNMAKYLREHEDYDIYHTNGLRNHLNHLTCATARRRGRPYIITPYGMINDYHDHRHLSLKRRISNKLFFRQDVEKASCLRAINMQEVDNFREMGYTNPIACIPWPNPIPEFLDKAVAKGEQWKKEHPSKRRIASVIVDVAANALDMVIDAFQAVASDNDELLLLNFGYSTSPDKARERVEANLKGNVRIVEPQTDFDNYALLASCSATIIPAHYLYLWPVVAQSLLSLTPVICLYDPETENVPAIDCGWWCPPSRNPLERVISAALLMDPSLLRQKGENGRKLIENKYATEVVAGKMIELYQWLLGEAPKPEFVY